MKNKISSILQKSINFLLFSALVFNAPSVWANMAAPSQGGTLAGEPGGLEKIYIRRENLTIDFRPVAAESEPDKRVSVEAVYEIENTGADKPLKLVFVLGSNDADNFEFYLDEGKIPSRFSEYSQLPDSWKAPADTPWHNDRRLYFSPRSNPQKTAEIELVIPKGVHTLKARYTSAPASYYGLAPQMLYQFAYVLAPAREWAGFGGLDLTIHLPEGWEMVTEPKLEQTVAAAGGGATIQAHFDTVPANALAVTFGKPLPPGYYRLKTILFWVAVLSVVIPALVLIGLFRRQYRKGKVRPALGFLLGLLWAFLVGGAGLAAAFGADYFYPTISYGYGGLFNFLMILALCFGVFVGGGLAWLVCALIFNKKGKR